MSIDDIAKGKERIDLFNSDISGTECVEYKLTRQGSKRLNTGVPLEELHEGRDYKRTVIPFRVTPYQSGKKFYFARGYKSRYTGRKAFEGLK